MAKYSEQFKLTVVKAYLEGNIGFRKVASQFSIDFSLLRRWVANYKSHGHTGHRKPGLRYSKVFKRSVLEHKREHGLSLRQTAAHFGIGDPGQIVIWEQQHYSNGLAPRVPTRRKPAAMPKKPYPTEPVTADDTHKTRDQLMAELEYLRMENAYLKKLEELKEQQRRQKKKP
ncbi:ISPsy9, transposase OrfA [Pseudomonas syringae pv. syringae str. B301D-R]|nr:ISPsy9, transposase OrfA [Pseudomonas syringae pv. syringae str. B301D-R]BBN60894.1 transposase [Pseudomonas sp. KUIN-1]